MNRYLLRSLVAVLTFSIGVAIGSLGSRSVNRFSRYRDCPSERQVKLRRTHFTHNSYSAKPGPFVSVDALSTDPLKLTYSSTTPLANDPGRQKVELLVANNTKREIVNFTVEYRSRWRSKRQGGGGMVSVSKDKTGNGNSTGLDVVSIECSGDENLAIWVSSVEFKDGSRWNNTRHSNEASSQGSSNH
jgi:hypothetical protein